ncbi:uncharacterized protein KGF55_005609 [Candida pseudojiufengensis]|uniref:uncharacterized protein n=1 Tax=Candida pseudojiufengensis TaxID=497109 RepID=UPI00222405F6|nr:uncharacterized protein KGF55_005609 [Candida pseudojiufengensis]KAI5958955.1 hypothetical protein KGF55_005609 [Candida pseudojiufengensis]
MQKLHRSLSQTKKWDIIQKKYFNIKFKELQHRNFVVPTVRTLQRQLAAGVKKAQSQRNKDDVIHPIPPTLDENCRDKQNIKPDFYETSNQITSQRKKVTIGELK